MRRTIFILTAAALMVVLMATTVSPAFAKWSNCGGAKGPCGWPVVENGEYRDTSDDGNNGIGWGAEDYS